jgi:hypothetical protein
MLHPGPLHCADSTYCEYSQVAGVAEVTIKHSYKDLYPKRFELIPAWYADRFRSGLKGNELYPKRFGLIPSKLRSVLQSAR